jgi:hypothetical protein
MQRIKAVVILGVLALTVGCGGSAIDSKTAALFDEGSPHVLRLVDTQFNDIGLYNYKLNVAWIFENGILRFDSLRELRGEPDDSTVEMGKLPEFANSGFEPRPIAVLQWKSPAAELPVDSFKDMVQWVVVMQPLETTIFKTQPDRQTISGLTPIWVAVAANTSCSNATCLRGSLAGAEMTE